MISNLIESPYLILFMPLAYCFAMCIWWLVDYLCFKYNSKKNSTPNRTKHMDLYLPSFDNCDEHAEGDKYEDFLRKQIIDNHARFRKLKEELGIFEPKTDEDWDYYLQSRAELAANKGNE